MYKEILVSVTVLALVGYFLFFYEAKPASDVNRDGAQVATEQLWESKTDEQAEVTVTVTPLDLSSQSTEWKFNVVMNTHSVELDHDMEEVAALWSGGTSYKPLRWEGALPGGHHREGVLIFAAPAPTPQAIDLRFEGIGGVTKSFTWDIL